MHLTWLATLAGAGWIPIAIVSPAMTGKPPAEPAIFIAAYLIIASLCLCMAVVVLPRLSAAASPGGSGGRHGHAQDCGRPQCHGVRGAAF